MSTTTPRKATPDVPNTEGPVAGYAFPQSGCLPELDVVGSIGPEHHSCNRATRGPLRQADNPNKLPPNGAPEVMILVLNRLVGRNPIACRKTAIIQPGASTK
jgi:hypothetical protein